MLLLLLVVICFYFNQLPLVSYVASITSWRLAVGTKRLNVFQLMVVANGFSFETSSLLITGFGRSYFSHT